MSSEQPRNPGVAPHFLDGGGVIGGLLRTMDWSRTDLGAPDHWPASLRATVRLILASPHPMLICWGPELRCLYNDAFARSLGDHKHPTSMGAPAREAWAEEWQVLGPCLHAVRDGQGASWHEALCVPVHRHGQVDLTYWTCSFSPLEGEGGGSVAGVLMICHETTAQVRAAHRAQTLARSLREAEQRQEEFLGRLAHDLRNPLAPIRNAAAVLKQGRDAQQSIWALGVIDRQVNVLSRTLDDVLDWSRLGRGTLVLAKRPVRMGDVLRAAIEIAQPLIERQGHSLRVLSPSEDLMAEVDPTRVAQAVAHLLSNAARFSDSAAEIHLALREEDGAMVIAVRDQGRGLEPQRVQQIFDLPAQVPAPARQGAGLGIGLALVRGIAELHGGRIEAASEGPGRGSTFTLRLPVERREEGTGAAVSLAALSESITILVVGGHRESVRAVGTQLAEAGHTVHLTFAEDAVQEIVAKVHPQVLIVDFTGLAFDGYRVALALSDHERRATLRLIALSSVPDEQHRKLALAAGFDALIGKPLNLDAFKHSLRRH